MLNCAAGSIESVCKTLCEAFRVPYVISIRYRQVSSLLLLLFFFFENDDDALDSIQESQPDDKRECERERARERENKNAI